MLSHSVFRIKCSLMLLQRRRLHRRLSYTSNVRVCRNVSRTMISSFAGNCEDKTSICTLITYIIFFSSILICRTIERYDYYRSFRDFIRSSKEMFKYEEESFPSSLLLSLSLWTSGLSTPARYFMKLHCLTCPRCWFPVSSHGRRQISRLVSRETGYKATKEPLYRGQTRRYL